MNSPQRAGNNRVYTPTHARQIRQLLKAVRSRIVTLEEQLAALGEALTAGSVPILERL